MDESGLEWRRVVEKVHLDGTKMLKKLSEQRKMRLRPCCKTDHHLICNSGILRREKSAAQAVKMPKERAWEEFSCRLDSNCSSSNKEFWLTIHRLRGKSLGSTTSIKDSTGNILQDEKENLSRWREYFEDLLNPVRATPTDTYNTIDFGKEKVFALTEVAAAIRGLKSEKYTAEDKIRPEILKALNEEGIRWLTRVCQVANLEKHQKTGRQL